MRPTRFLALIASAMLTPLPASAQIWDGGGGVAGPVEPGAKGVGRERRDIRESIRDGRKGGQLTRSEARSLRRENHRIGAVQERYGADGLSQSEAAELQSRALALQGLVNARRLPQPVIDPQ